MIPPWIPLYLAIGLLAALVLARREATPAQRAATAAISLFAWPLWVPIATFREEPAQTSHPSEAERRIHRALAEALDAVRGTALAALLPESSVDAMRASVARASTRIAELDLAVARPDHDVDVALARLARLEASDATSRALATARVHLDNVRRLAALLARERRALDELADLCDALRSQLVLARYAGSSLDGIGDIVGEVSARVEGLDGVLQDEGVELPP